MGFTIICNQCGNEQVVNNKKELVLEGIDVGVTEECGFQGCVVESIDITCWRCDNEINI